MSSKRRMVKSDYTRSVDLWSLGCVTVVLLTGGSAFYDPSINAYSEKLANECNLDFLHQRTAWRKVRPRPANFVARLLVLDESRRMTAKQALEHEWFSNEYHKKNFQEQYQRAIKGWKAAPTRTNVLEFKSAYDIQEMESLQPFLLQQQPPSSRRSRGDRSAQEAHLQPFPRKFFQALHPPRKPRVTLSSPEIRATIQQHWTDLSSDDEAPDAVTTARRDVDTKPMPKTKTAMLPPPIRPATARPRATLAKVSLTASKPPSALKETAGKAPTKYQSRADNTISVEPVKFYTKPLPPTVSSYFQTNIAVRPATQPPQRNEFQTSAIAPLDACSTKVKDIMSTNGLNADTTKTSKSTSSSMEMKRPARPPSVSKLRRPSRTRGISSSAAPSGKRRRSSIYDMDDGEDENLAGSTCIPKRQKRSSASDKACRDASNDAFHEVTLPHQPLLFHDGNNGTDLDLHLPR
jgi:hypothetical protein